MTLTCRVSSVLVLKLSSSKENSFYFLAALPTNSALEASKIRKYSKEWSDLVKKVYVNFEKWLQRGCV